MLPREASSLALYAVAPLALLPLVPAAVLVATYVVTGIGIELFNVPWFTATRREVEPRLLARVADVDFLFSYGLAPLASPSSLPPSTRSAPSRSCWRAPCSAWPPRRSDVGTRQFSGPHNR